MEARKGLRPCSWRPFAALYPGSRAALPREWQGPDRPRRKELAHGSRQGRRQRHAKTDEKLDVEVSQEDKKFLGTVFRDASALHSHEDGVPDFVSPISPAQLDRWFVGRSAKHRWCIQSARWE